MFSSKASVMFILARANEQSSIKLEVHDKISISSTKFYIYSFDCDCVETIFIKDRGGHSIVSGFSTETELHNYN